MFILGGLNNQGPVVRSQVSANRWLRVLKPVGFYGILRWLALTMLRATRARRIIRPDGLSVYSINWAVFINSSTFFRPVVLGKERQNFIYKLIIYMKKFIHSDWLREVQFFLNSAEKS